MATHGAVKAGRIAGNAAGVIGIELLAAAQGVDFHRPLRTSPALEKAHAAIRKAIPHHSADRYLADDIAWARQAVLDGALSFELEGQFF